MLLCEFTTIGKIPPVVIIDRFARFVTESFFQDESDPAGGAQSIPCIRKEQVIEVLAFFRDEKL
jgi:hypothetical protein